MAVLSRVRTVEAVAGRRRPGPDVIMLVAVVALLALGVLMVYSASRVLLEAENLNGAATAQRHAIFAAVGILAFVFGSLIDYREWRQYGVLLYIATLGILFLVLTPVGVEIQGAQRWIPLGPFQFQPAEFAKMAVVLTLAAVLAPARQEGMGWKRLGLALLAVAVPALLILLQPDLGTMLVFGFVAIGMIFAAGATFRQLAVLVGSGAFGVFLVLRLGLLADYQEARLRSFLSPVADPLGANYNLVQSQRAIGSGQFFGKGVFQGSQTNLSFVPEQPSDFIFTAVGEQLGFVGAALVLLAYAIIVWRLLVIASSSRDRYGSLVAVGVAAVLVFHIFVNIGMTIGIAPVTGLPLPLMSAGGSALLTVCFGLGVANSVWMRRSPVPGETYIL